MPFAGKCSSERKYAQPSKLVSHLFFHTTILLLNMGRFPSGQRGQTVNLLQIASVVRIHLCPLNCRRGGTGRRAGLKILWWRHRTGSIPVAGIKIAHPFGWAILMSEVNGIKKNALAFFTGTCIASSMWSPAIYFLFLTSFLVSSTILTLAVDSLSTSDGLRRERLIAI